MWLVCLSHVKLEEQGANSWWPVGFWLGLLARHRAKVKKGLLACGRTWLANWL
jgi:hypothetical protein